MDRLIDLYNEYRNKYDDFNGSCELAKKKF